MSLPSTVYRLQQKLRLQRPVLSTVNCQLSSGFTLIELMAVCAIIAIVTALVLANHHQYEGETILQDFAYDVALSIRQGQAYGISVQNSGCTDAYNVPYGLSFDLNNPTQYFLFADCNKNGYYDTGDKQIGNAYNIKQGYTISDVCAEQNGSCAGGTQAVYVVFQRPEPDAKISWRTGSGGGYHSCLTGAQCGDMARITLKSPQGQTRSVDVQSNGQIAVEPATP